MTHAVLAAAALLSLPACGDNSGEDPDSRTRVVVTIPLLADMVEEVGGDRLRIDALLPPGADPHTYEPAPRDVQLVSQAEIVFANGLGLEKAAIDLIDSNRPPGVPLIELAEEAAALGHEVISEGTDRHGANPHMWLDPEVAKEYVNIIHEQLSAIDPDGALAYDENYESYWDDVDAAETYLLGTAAEVTESHRVIVSTHDAFPYLARAIEFEVAAVVTASPGQEPSPQSVAQISEVISDSRVPAVFREPQLGPEADVLEQAASDAGADVCVLYSDALDDAVRTYVEQVRHNADEIARCLGG